MNPPATALPLRHLTLLLEREKIAHDIDKFSIKRQKIAQFWRMREISTFCAKNAKSQIQRVRRRIRQICANIFFSQLRLLRQLLRISHTLRFKKALFCASYKGFPAAGFKLGGHLGAQKIHSPTPPLPPPPLTTTTESIT